jgi:gluconolactonase
VAEFLEVVEPVMRQIVPPDATIERAAGGLGFTEGPVWVGDALLFSDIPRSRIARLQLRPEGPTLTTFRHPSGHANGLTLDRSRRLIACEHGNRRVSRTEPDGRIVTLASHYDGKRLNSPNDVVVRSDGSIYFTDPPYGLPGLAQGKELPFNGVYRITPEGELILLVDDFDRPNGLAFSPDERLLYVDDSPRRHIRLFDVHPDGSISGGQVFADMSHTRDRGSPDGMKIAEDGTIFCTGPGAVWVYRPDGALLGRIVPPEKPANLAWGDADRRTLYVTAETSVYRITLNVTGMPVV